MKGAQRKFWVSRMRGELEGNEMVFPDLHLSGLGQRFWFCHQNTICHFLTLFS